ncbi:hypothetical protein HPP92_009679 [Vanilla planifolia]|uniref:noroxomaritidine synthase n=1 Tax=Vanilla planifolia TaxID=51239 RepID=A0A835V4X5_VANPL|nr:hypothetical protein HPP92_009679 [Vanilla planifolia]
MVTMISLIILIAVCFALQVKHLTNPKPSYGPASYPIIGSLLSFYNNRHRLLHWYTDLLASSPTQTFIISRLGARRTVVTANPSNVEHILKTNFPNYPKGKPFTDILHDLLGRGIFNSDGSHWLYQRKLASHAFSLRSLRHLVEAVLHPELASLSVPELASASVEGRIIDLQDLLHRLSFRVICNVSLGTSEVPPELAEALGVASAISARRGAASMHVLWKIKKAMGIGSERRLGEALHVVHRSVAKIITRHRQNYANDKGESNLLSRFIVRGHGDEEIRDIAISFLMAGKDTTSSALTWFFWLVLTHPEVERKIKNELDNMEEDNMMSYEGLKELKYLEASLMESMRLYPPVVWDSKHADEDDVLPDGTVVRRGDRVMYFPFGMGRMEAIWGKDCGEFRPERWEGAAGHVSAFRFPVFQAGPRMCLGREMAVVQMKFVAAAVLRRFELRWVGAEKPEIVPLLTAHMEGGLPVVVRERGT